MKTNDENSRLFEKLEDILKAVSGKDVTEKFRSYSPRTHKITDADMMNYIIFRALNGEEIDQESVHYAGNLSIPSYELIKIYLMGLQASRK